jgi:hypothetical protein
MTRNDSLALHIFRTAKNSRELAKNGGGRKRPDTGKASRKRRNGKSLDKARTRQGGGPAAAVLLLFKSA